MKSIFTFLLFSLLLSAPQLTFAQSDSTTNNQFGFRTARGFIIPHSPTIEYLSKQHISQYEFYAERNTTGQKKWHSRYDQPGIGIAFSIFQFNNREFIGNGYSLSPYFNFNLFGKGDLRLKLRTNVGLGYIENIFHEDENFKNSAIGSHINLFLAMLLEGQWTFSKRMGITAGLNFSHFSNTGFKTPNLGINIITLTGGAYYKLGNFKAIKPLEAESYLKERAYWQLNAAWGLNEINPPNGNKYIATALSISREKRLNFKSSIGGGLDIFYNPAQREFLAADSIYINKGWENTQIAVSFIHVLHFGKLSFTGQLSYYLKTENKDLGNIYHMFGGRYAINDTYNIFISGKTHIDKAEYFLVGFGIKLKHDD